MDAIKESLSRISNLFDIIAKVFGFLGIWACILVIVSLVVIWLLYLVSPLEKRANFFLAFLITLGFAWVVQIPLEGVVRYSAFMLAPLVVAYAVHYAWLGVSKLFGKKAPPPTPPLVRR